MSLVNVGYVVNYKSFRLWYRYQHWDSIIACKKGTCQRHQTFLYSKHIHLQWIHLRKKICWLCIKVLFFLLWFEREREGEGGRGEVLVMEFVLEKCVKPSLHFTPFSRYLQHHNELSVCVCACVCCLFVCFVITEVFLLLFDVQNTFCLTLYISLSEAKHSLQHYLVSFLFWPPAFFMHGFDLYHYYFFLNCYGEKEDLVFHYYG